MLRLVAAHPKSRRASLVLLAVLAPVLLFSAPSKWMQSEWKRASIEPILSPQGEGWESAGTFNPAVIRHQGKFVMLYRAQDKSGTSRLGYAESKNGLHFQRRPEPVLAPEADYEKDGGVEDPRLVKFADTFYLTYTGYNKKDAQLCLATSKDLVHWQRQRVILPANKRHWNVRWTKSGAVVPEKINGMYWIYFLGTSADNSAPAPITMTRPGWLPQPTCFIGLRRAPHPLCQIVPGSLIPGWRSRALRQS